MHKKLGIKVGVCTHSKLFSMKSKLDEKTPTQIIQWDPNTRSSILVYHFLGMAGPANPSMVLF